MTILIAEDDPVNLMLVKGILNPLGHELKTASDGAEALEAIKAQIFDLFLFDVMMPNVDGFGLAQECRKDPRHRDVPILILTALSSKNDIIKGFEAGATDYISKPFHATELLHRVKAHLRIREFQLKMEAAVNEANLLALETERHHRELEAKDAELTKINRSLQDANKKLGDLASTDTLTGLFNRRKGWDFMGYEEERSRRSKKPVGVVLMDIDHFKQVNDTWGHETGDKVLQQTAKILTEGLRSADILIRWGGEEFLIVMPETDQDAAKNVAEKIRQSIESAAWDILGDSSLTISLGVAIKTPDVDWDTTIAMADRALYNAKEGGRNRVEVA